MKGILLQISKLKDSISTQEENVSIEKQETIIDILTQLDLGGNIVMGILLILSIFAVYTLIERYFALRRISKEDETFLKNIEKYVKEKNINDAKKICRTTNSPIARMIEKGLNRIDKPMTDISASIENQGKLEIYQMDNKLANLATIAGAAPMIGFLGTVIGMIIAFQEMAKQTKVLPSDLAGGIYTAMITTAAGLIVGIIAYIAYNYLVSKVDKVIFQLEAKTTEFLDLLHHNE